MLIERLFSRYTEIIPDYGCFLEYLHKAPAQSFRINTLKAKRNDILLLLQDFKLKPLPYYQDGFCLEERKSVGNQLTHNLGLIYGQEIASMIPVLVLDPKPNEVILDLCAAPGSKTTQICQTMKNTGLLIANELSRTRIGGLIDNLKRCGVLNEVIISLPGQRIDDFFPEYFDRILLDAPCSVEGTIRKSKAVLYHWGLKNIEKMARIQKGLITAGFRALRPGGTMVYSTCTIAPEENEGVISYLLEKFPEAELLPINIPNFITRPSIVKWQGETFSPRIRDCVRILPQDNDTAPFFIAQITKRGIAKHRFDHPGKISREGSIVDHFARRFGIDNQIFQYYSVFQEQDTYYIASPEVSTFSTKKTIRKGLEFGKLYDHEIKPDNDFVQIFGRQAKRNSYEMTERQLKKFLSGDKIEINPAPEIIEGFIIVTYKNLPIGVGRYNGKEVKSAIKMERRIKV